MKNVKIAVLLLVLLMVFIMSGCTKKDYNLGHVVTCEILSVTPSINEETNGFGAIVKRDFVYYIIYATPEGDVETIKWYPSQIELTDDYDRFEYFDYDNRSGWNNLKVYLTKDTFENLTGRVTKK